MNKIFLSDGEFKHTNDKVIITLYLYNRQKINFLIKLRNLYKKILKNKIILIKLYEIKKAMLRLVEYKQKKYLILKKVTLNSNLEFKFIKSSSIEKLNKKLLKRFRYCLYYKQLIYINKLKFSNIYLQDLTNLIKKIYKKNVEFNLINLKYFYYNSDIMTQSIILKLRKDRKKLLNYLNTCITKARIGNIQTSTRPKYYFDLDYLNLFIEKKLDTTNDLLYKLLIQNKTESKDLKKLVLNYIKYKKVSGIRIEAAGRLTKRYTASRSMLKTKYKGNLENISSSINGYPSALLRGNFKPNIQYTKLESKSRIGSFGVKG